MPAKPPRIFMGLGDQSHGLASKSVSFFIWEETVRQPWFCMDGAFLLPYVQNLNEIGCTRFFGVK